MRRIHYKNTKAVLIAMALVLGFNLAYGEVAFATTDSSSASSVYMAQWGSSGSGNSEFSDPYGVVTNDSTGNVYVLDSDNSRIQEFSGNGTYITQWGTEGTGNSEFEFAPGIAINQSSGDIYVADQGNTRVQEFSGNGTYITQWGTEGTGNSEFEQNYFVAVNSSTGDVYVTDSANNRVQEFTSNGTYITQWGTSGSGNGQFFSAFAIAVNDSTGDVYVSDSSLDNIQVFTSNGTYITQWGNQGTGNSQFNWPFGIAVNDSTGNVYVSDGNNNNVQEFTSNGTYITQWGTVGTGDGQFTGGAAGLAFDQSNDYLYVGDVGNSRIEEFGPAQNLAQETSPYTSNSVNLTLPSGSNITNESIASPTTSDGSYSFPLGLLNFTFATPSNVVGATVPVQLTFQTTLSPDQVVPQKYNSTTKTYTAIPNATVTETTVNGKAALLLSYSVTDGGALDQDGTANGVIVDPVGLATIATTPTATTSIAAPDTGYGAPVRNINNLAIYISLTMGSLSVALGFRRLKTKR